MTELTKKEFESLMAKYAIRTHIKGKTYLYGTNPYMYLLIKDDFNILALSFDRNKFKLLNETMLLIDDIVAIDLSKL